MGRTIDFKDRKILAELDKNARISFSKIAKNVGLSREVVQYRFNNLNKKGIIKRFFTEYNLAKLNVNWFRICLSFQNFTREKEDEVYQFFSKAGYSLFVVSGSGKWDMVIGVGIKNVMDFNILITRFLDKFSSIMLTKEIMAINFFEVYNKKWLHPSKKLTRSTLVDCGGNTVELDKSDQAILGKLALDCRYRIVDLAKITHLSPTTVAYRIKTLESQGLINSYRVELDGKKLGMESCQAFLYLHQTTTIKQNKIIQYCRQHPNIVTIFQCVGSWDIEIEFEVENFTQFHNIMWDMRTLFPFIKSYESIIITRTFGPFYPTKGLL